MKRKTYPTDLSNEQYKLLEPLLPCEKPEGSRGRKRLYTNRELLNGILYHLRVGGAWRTLPHDLPHWNSVYAYFRRWSQNGTLDRLQRALRRMVRQQAGKEPEPSVVILDSQSVKTTDKGGPAEQASIGYDANKKIKGRKRHIAVDTLGLLFGVEVTAASVQDREGALPVLAQLEGQSQRLEKLYADQIYAGFLEDYIPYVSDWVLEIVRKPADQQGFVVHAKRWIVERTFAWLGKYRRLVRDYEYLVEVSKAMICWAMVSHMLGRLTRMQATS